MRFRFSLPSSWGSHCRSYSFAILKRTVCALFFSIVKTHCPLVCSNVGLDHLRAVSCFAGRENIVTVKRKRFFTQFLDIRNMRLKIWDCLDLCMSNGDIPLLCHLFSRRSNENFDIKLTTDLRIKKGKGSGKRLHYCFWSLNFPSKLIC